MRTEPSHPHVVSVNLAVVRENPFKGAPRTGIDKQPTGQPVEVRDPGSKSHGRGSGLVGDFIGDRRSHGGHGQAIYAYAMEDLQWFADRLGVPLAAGQFGENLTTAGVEVTEARIGERWHIGPDVVLQVTGPRIPCVTFRGWMRRPGWLRTFTDAGRPGAYLSVLTPGLVQRGQSVVVDRPEHHVTVGLAFRALTNEPQLLPQLLAADLPDELRTMAEEGRTFSLG